MTIQAGVGISRHHNPNVAGREAAEQALFNNMALPPYQYCDDEVITDGVSYALLSGKVRAGWV